LRLIKFTAYPQLCRKFQEFPQILLLSPVFSDKINLALGYFAILVKWRRKCWKYLFMHPTTGVSKCYCCCNFFVFRSR